MGLFNFGKKKNSCCCGGDKTKCAEQTQTKTSSIKILGGGCAKCDALEANTMEALKALGMEQSVEHVSDFAQIATYGVMTTPALVVDEKVLCYGKVAQPNEIIDMIKKQELKENSEQ